MRYSSTDHGERVIVLITRSHDDAFEAGGLEVEPQLVPAVHVAAIAVLQLLVRFESEQQFFRRRRQQKAAPVGRAYTEHPARLQYAPEFGHRPDRLLQMIEQGM